MALSPASSRGSSLPTQWDTSNGSLSIDAAGFPGAALGVVEIDNASAGNALYVAGAIGVPDAALPSLKLTDPSSPGETVLGYGRQSSITSSFSPAAGSSVFKVIHGGAETGDLCLFGTTRVLANGTLVINQHSAPADADLNAGDCALWFDQTNGAGATKLMVKGKSADGTVKTATILLA